MGLKRDLLETLVCPKCRGDLVYEAEAGRLVCHACRLGYPVRDDIPVMLIEEAEETGED
jgi:uncharacterized protein YbaR (Trm112 family)